MASQLLFKKNNIGLMVTTVKGSEMRNLAFNIPLPGVFSSDESNTGNRLARLFLYC